MITLCFEWLLEENYPKGDKALFFVCKNLGKGGFSEEFGLL